jgi:pimeloyl-ACP methyl ester carboxylesterase
MSRPWAHGPAEVTCPVRAWFGELDDRAPAEGAAELVAGLPDVEVTVRPGTTHLATLVAYWPEVLTTLRDLHRG